MILFLPALQGSDVKILEAGMQKSCNHIITVYELWQASSQLVLRSIFRLLKKPGHKFTQKTFEIGVCI